MSSKSPAASPQPIKVRVHVSADHLVRLRRLAFGRYDAAGFRVPDDFDAPLPDDVLASFDGEPDEQL